VDVLVVDDDARARELFSIALGAVAHVVTADDGEAAVGIAADHRFDAALLDLNMPRRNGVESARQLAVLQPSLAIALQSSDLADLRQRAAGLGVPVFDKLDLDQIVAWVVTTAHRRSRRCARCGYGVVRVPPPLRCPICDTATRWTA
jgi:CheY-like chemotaxis protein